jgi:hypothetical protein
MLAPVVAALAKAFVWIYNEIIRPVGNGIIRVFKMIEGFFVRVANAIIRTINKIFDKDIKLLTRSGIGDNPLGKITYEDVTNAGASTIQAAETTTAGGGGASYTAGRTINQTVNIYTDVIAGEGGIRDLAVMIRDEIYSAEALGA